MWKYRPGLSYGKRKRIIKRETRGRSRKAQLGEDVFEKASLKDVVKIRREIDEAGAKLVYFRNKSESVRDEKVKDYYRREVEVLKKKRDELKKQRDELKEILDGKKESPQPAPAMSEIKQEIEKEAVQTQGAAPSGLEKVIAPKENKFDLWNPRANVRSAYDNSESALNNEIIPAIEELDKELNASAVREMETKIKDIYSYNLSEIKSGKQIEEWEVVQNCSAKAILGAASYRDSAFGPFVGEVDHEEINNRIELQNYLRELAIKNKTAPEENETVKDFIFRAIKSAKNSSELDHWLEQKEKAAGLTSGV